MEERKEHVIGGRRWRTIERETLEHRVHIEPVAHFAGLDQIQKGDDEGVADFLIRVQRLVVTSGKAWQLFGLLFIPAEKQDVDWTPGMMADTAEFFRTLQGDEDIAAAQNLLLAGLMGFFARRLTSDEDFHSFLNYVREQAALEDEAKPARAS